MKNQTVFKRYELKFLITEEQCAKLKSMFYEYMTDDAYGKSIIRNIYFDTPSHLLIRNSIDKPVYKEKIRLRSYGETTADTPVFLELKKKFKGVVYKRRVRLKEKEAVDYIAGKSSLPDNQISREIDYFISYYKDLMPSMVISYEREAFYSKTDETFRITFDRNILYREDSLSLESGVFGKRILDDGIIVMEVKTAYALPLWFTSFLSENKIYKTSFSKYGTAYIDVCQSKKKELIKC
ncbi:MAG: polyphosphate polymerase domain-containing protein [Clostridia bacterium]|nr:polyphosphate polymerase domain-containing protein [Clostridia bacterium]